MPRRTHLALTCAVLALTLPTACAGSPPDGGSVADQQRVSAESPADEPDPTPRADEDGEPDEPPDDVPAALPGTTPGGIASVLGPGTDLTTTPLGADRVREIRGGPDVQGAFDTAVLLLVAWQQSMTTGDASVLRSLALDSCHWCTSVAQTASAAPLRAEDGYLLTFTVWPLTDSLTSAGGTVSVVLESVVTLAGAADGASDGDEQAQALSVDQVVVDVAVEQSPDGWAVAGVQTSPWTAAAG